MANFGNKKSWGKWCLCAQPEQPRVVRLKGKQYLSLTTHEAYMCADLPDYRGDRSVFGSARAYMSSKVSIIYKSGTFREGAHPVARVKNMNICDRSCCIIYCNEAVRNRQFLVFNSHDMLICVSFRLSTSTGKIGRIGRHRAETSRHFNIRFFGPMPPDASDFPGDLQHVLSALIYNTYSLP